MARPSEHTSAKRPLSTDEADELADAMSLFASGSRLKLLWAMFEDEHTVEELAGLAGMTSSAASHQLRLLREASLVSVRREGRWAYYRLHDHHIPDLLAALRHHHEHTQVPVAGDEADGPGPGAKRSTAGV